MPYELFACDPALADTAAFCAAYGFDPEDSANTIVVIGKSDPPRYAACVTLAPYRLDVNRAVRDRLGTRKASFAPAEDTAALTGMQMGGVTVFGLPAGPADLGRRAGDGPGADRARRRLAVVEGHRVAGDPAGAARGGGRGGPGDRAATGRVKAPRRRPAVSFRLVTDQPSDPRADPTPPRRPRQTGPVQYKGDDLEAERGPGLGCFRIQVVVLVIFIVLTPLSVAWDWPIAVSTVAAVRGHPAAAGHRPDDHLPAPAGGRGPARPPPAAGERDADGRRARGRGEPGRPGRSMRAPPPADGPPSGLIGSAGHGAGARVTAMAPCDNTGHPRHAQGGPDTVPVLATYFSVRRGRDPFFKFFMRTIFPRQVKDYEEKFGIRFIGWFNVAHGWDFDNVILLDLPDYATLDKLEADEATRALGHRAGEWIFERHHSMFLRERMGPDLEYHP